MKKFVIFSLSLILINFMALIACSQVDESDIVSSVAKVVSITVTQNPTKTAYYVNEAFDPAGLVITAAYSDGLSKLVTGYSLSSPGMDTAGTKTIVVTFEGKTAAFNITVTAASEVSLVLITATQNPTKTIYYVNEAFDSTGLVITAVYSDGSSKPVIGYSLSSPSMDTAGTKTIVVTFEGKTATFNITVTAASEVSLVLITVTQNPTKTAYYINETFDPTGLVVTATYSDGLSRPVDGYSLSTPSMDTAGTKIIFITFEGKSATFNITVIPRPDEGDLGVIIY
jgi:predicted CoA-binding protein